MDNVEVEMTYSEETCQCGSIKPIEYKYCLLCATRLSLKGANDHVLVLEEKLKALTDERDTLVVKCIQLEKRLNERGEA